MKLDNEEKEIKKTFEQGEWKSVKKLENKKLEYQKIAKNTFKKEKKININISEKDLTRLKAKSLEIGIPYQTLVASIIHKYLTGKFKEV